jgi:nucleotide-binding universal stress UspA family protein
MRPILLATDGSPSAAEATLEAIELAKALDAPLVAISVSHITVPAYGYYGYTEVVSQLTKADEEHVARVLAQTKEAAAAAGVGCETVAGRGPIVEAICNTARGRNARLIVVGAHGWRPLRRMVARSSSLTSPSSSRRPMRSPIIPRSASRRVERVRFCGLQSARPDALRRFTQSRRVHVPQEGPGGVLVFLYSGAPNRRSGQ